MEPNTNPQTPPQVSTQAPMSTPVAASSEPRKVGPIIAILVIVVILVIAAIYLFASRMNKEPAPAVTNTTAVQTPISNVQNESAAGQSVMPVTNTSDDITALEADLNASTNGLDGQNF